MSITAEQIKTRQRFIGSSDVAALFTDKDGCSLSPFATAYDVWADKCFARKRAPETASQGFGNRYEAPLLGWAALELGCKIETRPGKLEFIDNTLLDANGNPFNMSHPDGFTLGQHTFETAEGLKLYADTSGIEAKTSRTVSEFGEEGTDQVPFRVILQAQHQMMCAGWKRVFIPALLGSGLREVMFLVERDDRIISAIRGRVAQFWNDHVLTKSAPPETMPCNIEIFKRIERVPNKYADVDREIVCAYEEANEAVKVATKAKDEAFHRLLEAMGDAEACYTGDGREFTYFEENGGVRIDSKKLKAEYPEAYLACGNPTTRRMPRFKKIK